MAEHQIVTSVDDELYFTTSTINSFKAAASLQTVSPVPLVFERESLTRTSSMSSIVDWSGVENNYNSLMENPLFDSFAEILEDISSDFERSIEITPEKIYSSSFTNRWLNVERSNFSKKMEKTNNNNFISMEGVEQIEIWLNQMEEFVQSQPKLTKKYSNVKSLIAQRDVFIKIHKELNIRAPIINRAERNGHEQLKERYNLLYLKVYEVIQLLENLLEDDQSSTLNSDHYRNLNDYQSFDQIDNDNTDHGECQSDSTDALTNIQLKLSKSNIGIYSFTYNDSMHIQIEPTKCDDNDGEKIGSFSFEQSDLTYKSDIQSLFNSSSLKGACAVESACCAESTNVDSTKIDSEQIDFGYLMQISPITLDEELHSMVSSHHKVFDWLLSSKCNRKTKSTSNLNLKSKLKCDKEMPALKRSKSAPCFRVLFNNSQEMYSHVTLDDTCTETNSLTWDNLEALQSLIEHDITVEDFEMIEMANNLCYFGDDYAAHFNDSDDDDDLNISSCTESTCLTNSTNISGASTLAMSSNIETTMETIVEDEIESKEPEERVTYNSDERCFEIFSNESTEPKKMKISDMRPEHFYDMVKVCQTNINCLYTVLRAEPNQILTVAYCQQMQEQRRKETTPDNSSNSSSDQASQLIVDNVKNGDCTHSNTNYTCVCAWVSHTIAMILNFLIDWWNCIRNMKLYVYLCRITATLFNSTRHVADHLISKRNAINNKTIKYL